MLKTAKIFQSGMVLQRNKPVKVWGRGESGSEISVSIQNKHASGVVFADGHWAVKLPPLETSLSETLEIRSGGECLTYRNVAVGEVWIGAGQSNMEFYMKYEKHRGEERRFLPNPLLRFYEVPKIAYEGQDQDFDYSAVGIWRNADDSNINYFIATGYYFQKYLAEILNVPVGIVGCSWGGTTSSVWMSEKSLVRVGRPWIDRHEEDFSGIDMREYWREQRHDYRNHHGNDTGNPFLNFMMPRTPSQEEMMEFMKDFLGDGEPGLPPTLPETFPGCLFEHMVKAVAPFSVRGVLWYQGESDDLPGMQALYQDMLSAIISDWRQLWDEEIPFFIVQLPGFLKWLDTENQHFDIIRSCQEKVTESVPDTWLCSISDAGEERDIHPKNKKIVGERLALLARGHIYGEDILCDPPKASGIKYDAGRIIITFENAGGGLTVKGDRLNAMRVLAGDEEIPFRSYTNGSQLILETEMPLADDVKVLFAQEKWFKVNLYNSAGIPAIPFLFERQ